MGKAIAQKPPKPPTPLRGAAKSCLGYRRLPLRSALYKTYIQIKYKSSHIYCREEICVYSFYRVKAMLTINITIYVLCIHKFIDINQICIKVIAIHALYLISIYYHFLLYFFVFLYIIERNRR